MFTESQHSWNWKLPLEICQGRVTQLTQGCIQVGLGCFQRGGESTTFLDSLLHHISAENFLMLRRNFHVSVHGCCTSSCHWVPLKTGWHLPLRHLHGLMQSPFFSRLTPHQEMLQPLCAVFRAGWKKGCCGVLPHYGHLGSSLVLSTSWLSSAVRQAWCLKYNLPLGPLTQAKWLQILNHAGKVTHSAST